METVGLERAGVSAEGIEASDAEGAGRMGKLITWARKNGIKNLRREARLIAEYMNTYGWCVAHVIWERELQGARRKVTTEDIIGLAARAEPGSVIWALPGLIGEPEREEEAANGLRVLYPLYAKMMEPRLLPDEVPELGMARARRVVRELREDGEAQVPVTLVAGNRPAVQALQPYVEFFISRDCVELQRARYVFRVAWLTVEEVRAWTRGAEGWNEEWAEAVIAAKGAESVPSETTAGGQPVLDRSDLCEVVWAYTRGVDEDGVPVVWQTVFSPSQGEEQKSRQEEIGYNHGEYPFVVFAREQIKRRFMSSRGVPEIVMTWQDEKKVQRDAIRDRTSLDVLPPLKVPTRNAGKLYRLKPAGFVYEDHPDEVDWMHPPPGDLRASELTLTRVETDVDEFFGRPSERVPPGLSQVVLQATLNGWLDGWREVFKQAISLMVQYLSDEEWERITGSSAVTRALAETGAAYDWTIEFDVSRLDAETLTARLKAFMEYAVSSDAAGVIDRGRLTALLANAIDPTIAQAVLQEAGQASQQMFRHVREQVAQMVLGNPPELAPDADPAAAAKMRFTQQVIQQNPKYQALLEQDANFQALMKTWQDNLQFNMAQGLNRTIGRLGTNLPE
jgi:hypothetical protein